jgi:hypothetical protein
MGAPIPTHNPLYIIYNFQQEVLFLHNWGVKLKSQVRTPPPPPILVTKIAACVHAANPLIHVAIDPFPCNYVLETRPVNSG